jgi:hypothetical protein
MLIIRITEESLVLPIPREILKQTLITDIQMKIVIKNLIKL